MSPQGHLSSCFISACLLPAVGCLVLDEVSVLTKALSELRTFYQIFFPQAGPQILKVPVAMGEHFLTISLYFLL